MRLIRDAEDIAAESLEPAFIEFRALVEGLPMLGEGDPEQGPKIEVPNGLEHYWCWSQKASGWRHYSFHNLGKVQTLQFMELCRAYGYGTGGGRVKDQMAPLEASGMK